MGETLGNAVIAAAPHERDIHLEREPLMSASVSPTTDTLAGTSPHEPAAAPALPRLLAGIPAHGAIGLEEHSAIHGPLPLERGRGRRVESPLIGRVERAGLRGHGGAGFPTSTKLRAVAARRRKSVVVINAAEAEPASHKDRTLLEALPHLVLDGGQLAAQAVGADELIVCVSEAASTSIASITAAIAERERLPGTPARIVLSTVPGHYVAGQETALVNHLNGGPAIPTFTPPMPFEHGVRRRPTVINNAETLAHIALIARHGSQWFRQLGPPSQPGSALVTLSGPVAYPGVYEIEHGASLSSLIGAAGGGTTRARAALLGGYAGAWIGGELLGGLSLSDEQLAPHGASLGAGVVLLLSEEACPVAETARVARWLAGQSTAQCGPCVNGLDALATTVEQIAGGVAGSGASERVARLASLVRRRGACGHPDGAVNLVSSALETFAGEFADHARHGPCDACERPGELPIPRRPRAARPREWA
jgi:NADH:ubiquinone oxidoreductase subunit F (NADH-binding)